VTATTPARLTPGQHCVVLGAAVALVGLLTYPLAIDPGHLLPLHKDPLMYAWTMVSNTRRLLSTPLTVFHGNTFYPHGGHANTLRLSFVTVAPELIARGVAALAGVLKSA